MLAWIGWKAVTGIILFMAMIALGLALAKTGRPYPQALLAFHKVAAVLSAVFLGMDALDTGKSSGWDIAKAALYSGAGLFFLASVAGGAFLTAEKPLPWIAGFFHKAGPALATALTAAAFLLLHWKRN